MWRIETKQFQHVDRIGKDFVYDDILDYVAWEN